MDKYKVPGDSTLFFFFFSYQVFGKQKLHGNAYYNNSEGLLK